MKALHDEGEPFWVPVRGFSPLERRVGCRLRATDGWYVRCGSVVIVLLLSSLDDSHDRLTFPMRFCRTRVHALPLIPTPQCLQVTSPQTRDQSELLCESCKNLAGQRRSLGGVLRSQNGTLRLHYIMYQSDTDPSNNKSLLLSLLLLSTAF